MVEIEEYEDEFKDLEDFEGKEYLVEKYKQGIQEAEHYEEESKGCPVVIEETPELVKEERVDITTEIKEGGEEEQEPYRATIMRAVQRNEDEGKKAMEAGRYNYAYGQYKEILRQVADFLIMHKNDPEMVRLLQEKQKLLAINGALACMKTNHYEQALECSRLVLDKGALTPLQHQKALYRAGESSRILGDFKEAKKYATDLMNLPGISNKTKRDAIVLLKNIKVDVAKEKAFAKRFLSGKGKDIIVQEMSQKDREKKIENEKRREDYLERQHEKELRKEKEKPPMDVKKPKILISDEECVTMLDTLIERYSNKDVIEKLKAATMDHEYVFSKGYIQRSRKILNPLQKDVMEKYGFLSKDDLKAYNADIHAKSLTELTKTVRYLSSKNSEIASKAERARRLALGGDGGIVDTVPFF